MIPHRGWLCVVVVACDGGGAPLDAPPVPDPEGRLARYLLDDEPTDGVRAEVGSDGRCTRCPSLVSGREGGAYMFDGAGDLVLAQASAMTGATELTAAAWVRPGSGQPETGCVVGSVLGLEDRNSWQVCVTRGAGIVVCRDNLALQGGCMSTGPGVLTVGTWHHLAVTFDGSTMRAHVDTTEVFSAPQFLAIEEGALVIGGDVDFGAPIGFFVGAIDDVRVWNRALSAGELAVEASP